MASLQEGGDEKNVGITSYDSDVEVIDVTAEMKNEKSDTHLNDNFNEHEYLRLPYQVAVKKVFSHQWTPQIFDAQNGERFVSSPPPENSVVVKAVYIPSEIPHEGVVNLYCSVSKKISHGGKFDGKNEKSWVDKSILGGVIALGIVAVALLSIFVFNKVEEARQIVIPNITGLTVDEGTRLLSQDGFMLGSVQDISSSDKPVGVILSQSPSAGEKLAGGGSVNIIVSSGPRVFKTPNLVGMNVEQAKNSLTAMNLGVGEISERDSEKPVGEVIEQTPPADSDVTEKTAVGIIVSNGKTAVPSVIGQTLEQASVKLAEAGFAVKPVRITQEGTAGTVVAQNPAANTYLIKGSEVEITYTTPPTVTPTPTAPAP